MATTSSSLYANANPGGNGATTAFNLKNGSVRVQRSGPDLEVGAVLD